MNRKLVVAAVATAALAVGGSTLAFADDDTAQDALAASLRAGADSGDRGDDADDRDNRDDGDDSRGDDRSDDRDDDRGDDDREELRTLRGAEVTLQEAVAAALKAVPGTAESAELEDDDSDRPVWEVGVLGEDGTWHEVSVDAGSADVLERSAESDDRDGGDDDRGADTDDKDDRDDDRDDRDDLRED
ncbi:PepSY domain-containing protein [Streptomyces chitinivorans]|uniref:PepSY domain-containing protein n=1 Tax=Streptomyces chitinivorans TaxID=1257027 RepID=A0ABW7HLF7_9ACTN|nr:PepSY domain-containing protein [Streptomyces chitinivorans]MDH2408069.1 PepSY domain-containing protein [Streptomyces chitinivorans]